jgi:hypothetical protein
MNDDFDLSKLVKKKRNGINSKAKGGRFERKIAEMLNARFNTTDFCRTPGSGAFATTHKLPDHLKIYGDLITPKNFKFIIECKSGYNKEGICNLFNPNSILSEMIAQAERDSEKCSKKFMLVIGQDRSEVIVLTNKPIFKEEISSGEGSWICLRGKTYCACRLSDLFKLSDSFFLETN